MSSFVFSKRLDRLRNMLQLRLLTNRPSRQERRRQNGRGHYTSS